MNPAAPVEDFAPEANVRFLQASTFLFSWSTVQPGELGNSGLCVELAWPRFRKSSERKQRPRLQRFGHFVPKAARYQWCPAQLLYVWAALPPPTIMPEHAPAQFAPSNQFKTHRGKNSNPNETSQYHSIKLNRCFMLLWPLHHRWQACHNAFGRVMWPSHKASGWTSETITQTNTLIFQKGFRTLVFM